MAMYDEDQDTLAAEYVLGTLSAEEREQAEALRSFDPGFDAAVRQWERRLGELNVMVEAVEPPPETWEKIKTQDRLRSSRRRSRPELSTARAAGTRRRSAAGASPRRGAWTRTYCRRPIRARRSNTPAESWPPQSPSADTTDCVRRLSRTEPKVERSADVVYLAGRVTRWRRVTSASARSPRCWRSTSRSRRSRPILCRPSCGRCAARMTARSEPPAPARISRIGWSPCCNRGRTRRHSCSRSTRSSASCLCAGCRPRPEAGKSYELWLISTRFPAPRSLGIVGSDEFTQRPLPGNYDVDTLRGASLCGIA